MRQFSQTASYQPRAPINRAHLELLLLPDLLRNTTVVADAISGILMGDTSLRPQEEQILSKSHNMQIRTVIIVVGMAILRQIVVPRRQEKRQENAIPDELTRIR